MKKRGCAFDRTDDIDTIRYVCVCVTATYTSLPRLPWWWCGEGGRTKRQPNDVEPKNWRRHHNHHHCCLGRRCTHLLHLLLWLVASCLPLQSDRNRSKRWLKRERDDAPGRVVLEIPAVVSRLSSRHRQIRRSQNTTHHQIDKRRMN